MCVSVEYHHMSHPQPVGYHRSEQVKTDKQLPNLLQESKLKLPVALHTYLKNSTEDPTPHLVAFQIFRQVGFCI